MKEILLALAKTLFYCLIYYDFKHLVALSVYLVISAVVYELNINHKESLIKNILKSFTIPFLLGCYIE